MRKNNLAVLGCALSEQFGLDVHLGSLESLRRVRTLHRDECRLQGARIAAFVWVAADIAPEGRRRIVWTRRILAQAAMRWCPNHLWSDARQSPCSVFEHYQVLLTWPTGWFVAVWRSCSCESLSPASFLWCLAKHLGNCPRYWTGPRMKSRTCRLSARCRKTGDILYLWLTQWMRSQFRKRTGKNQLQFGLVLEEHRLGGWYAILLLSGETVFCHRARDVRWVSWALDLVLTEGL